MPNAGISTRHFTCSRRSRRKSWQAVGSIVERVVSRRLNPERLAGLRRIGVDEIRSAQDARLALSDINLFMLSSLLDLRADALRLHLTLQDDPHYAERRQAVLRKKVEQCADTFKTLLARDPLTAFRGRLRQELGDVGRFERLPWGLTDTAVQVIRTLGGGRSLEKTIRTLDTILDKGFAPVQSRMQRWVSELEASAAAAREESIVFYQERDGQRALKAYHTRDVQLRQAVA